MDEKEKPVVRLEEKEIERIAELVAKKLHGALRLARGPLNVDCGEGSYTCDAASYSCTGGFTCIPNFTCKHKFTCEEGNRFACSVTYTSPTHPGGARDASSQ